MPSFNAAQEEFVEAKLEAANKPEERIALLKEQLKIARDTFEYREQQQESGFYASNVETYRAKAHCLKVEIELAKEEAKQDEANAAEKR